MKQWKVSGIFLQGEYVTYIRVGPKPSFFMFCSVEQRLLWVFHFLEVVFQTPLGKNLILGHHVRSDLPPINDLGSVLQVIDVISYKFHVTLVFTSCHDDTFAEKYNCS